MKRTIILLIGLTVGVEASAQDKPQCFCLLNEATLSIEHYGCEARVIPSRGIERVSCQTPDFDRREDLPTTDGLTRILDGEGQCRPCYQPRRQGSGDDPRGGQGDAEDATGPKDAESQ